MTDVLTFVQGFNKVTLQTFYTHYTFYEFTKASLDCRLWQWYSQLLKSVLTLDVLDVVKLFYLSKNMDTTTGFRCSRDGHCMHSFEYLTKLLIWTLLEIFLSRWWTYFSFQSSLSCIGISLGLILRIPVKSYQFQFQHLESTRDLFICLMCHRMRVQASPVYETACR